MSPRAPNKNHARALAVGFASLFIAVGTASLLAIALPMLQEHRRTAQLVADGIEAKGIVLTKRRASAGQLTVLGLSTALFDHFVRYRFPLAGGGTAEGTAKVTPEAWGELNERGAIEVRYVPAYPAINSVAGALGTASGASDLVFALIGAGFTALGASMLFMVLRR